MGGKKKSKLRVVKGGKNGKKAAPKKKFDEEAFYKKYKHVVSGSVKEAKPGSVVDGCKVAHGRICKIKCKETGKLRTINVQDAFQTFFTAEVQKRKQLERAAERRKKSGKKARRKSKAG
ncbi:MAG: hypothetical protein ACWGQW_08420 [bacterium]